MGGDVCVNSTVCCAGLPRAGSSSASRLPPPTPIPASSSAWRSTDAKKRVLLRTATSSSTTVVSVGRVPETRTPLSVSPGRPGRGDALCRRRPIHTLPSTGTHSSETGRVVTAAARSPGTGATRTVTNPSFSSSPPISAEYESPASSQAQPRPSGTSSNTSSLPMTAPGDARDAARAQRIRPGAKDRAHVAVKALGDGGIAPADDEQVAAQLPVAHGARGGDASCGSGSPAPAPPARPRP